MSAWWSPNLGGVAPGAATGVSTPFGEFIQRDPNRAIGYQNQAVEGQFAGNYAPPTTGYTTAKYNTAIAYDPSRDAIGAGADVTRWTNDLVNEYRRRGLNLDWNAVYADQWARKKRDLLAWGNPGDLARAGVDMNAIDANAHDIGNAGWEERFKAAGYASGGGTPAATKSADTRGNAIDDPYKIGAFRDGYYDPDHVRGLLDQAMGKGTYTTLERMQAAEMLRTVGLIGDDNQPLGIDEWAKSRNLRVWRAGDPMPGTAPSGSTSSKGGQAVSMPGDYPGAGGGMGTPAAAPIPNATTAAPSGGAWSENTRALVANDPQQALLAYFQMAGIDPSIALNSKFGTFMAKNFTDMWKAYTAAQGVPDARGNLGANVVNGIEDLLRGFTQGMITPGLSASQMTRTAANNAIDAAMRQGTFNTLGDDLGTNWLTQLMSGAQAGSNPYMAAAQDNLLKLINIARLNEARNSNTGVPSSQFGTFLQNNDFWRQLSALR